MYNHNHGKSFYHLVHIGILHQCVCKHWGKDSFCYTLLMLSLLLTLYLMGVVLCLVEVVLLTPYHIPP